MHLLLWAGVDPHRKVPSLRELGDPLAWEDPEMLSSSAGLAILYGRHQLFHVLRVETMPDLEAHMAQAADTSTLEKLVALKPPATGPRSSSTSSVSSASGTGARPGTIAEKKSWRVRAAVEDVGGGGGARAVRRGREANRGVRHRARG